MDIDLNVENQKSVPWRKAKRGSVRYEVLMERIKIRNIREGCGKSGSKSGQEYSEEVWIHYVTPFGVTYPNAIGKMGYFEKEKWLNTKVNGLKWENG